MKNIIIKVPTLVFLLLLFSPLLLLYFGKGFIDFEKNIFLTRLIPVFVSSIWLFSLITYMQNESKIKKNVTLSYVLLTINLIGELLIIYIYFYEIETDQILLMELGNALLFTILAVFITKIVKTVFYARTIWFLFLEIFALPLGMFTLTLTIKEWENGDKK